MSSVVILPQLPRAFRSQRHAEVRYRLALAAASDGNHTKAAQYTISAARNDHAAGRWELSRLYADGQGLRAHSGLAMVHQIKAAELGHAEAQFQCGICYERGLGGVAQSDATALHWYRRAAAQDHAGAMRSLAELVAQYAGPTKGPAGRGADWAQVELALLTRAGRGVAPSLDRYADLVEAAANQGGDCLEEAAFLTGECYDRGTGVEENADDAAFWYQAAAERGHREAQYRLAECTRVGRGVLLDTEEAAKWFLLAAEGGHVDAQYRCALLCEAGKV